MEESNNPPPIAIWFFYLLSFFEGGVVMSAEISGAKFLAPFYGSSLYVWTCIMAVTLGGLASGYFIGGRLSQRKNLQKVLVSILIPASLYFFLLPLSKPFFVLFGSSLPLIPATLISSFLVVFPPLFLLGMISPVLIALLSRNREESGKRAGEVYAVSTVGGIVFTFLTGFYFLPELGVPYTGIINGGILFLFVTALLIKSRNFFGLFMVALCVSFFEYVAANNTRIQQGVIYESDGLLGNILVRDNHTQDSIISSQRFLLVNGVIQSCLNFPDSTSGLEYTTVLQANLARLFPNPKRVLILGLGGGVVAEQLRKSGASVTAVEIDERMSSIAKAFFNMNSGIKVITDDARHFINSCKEKYDVVLFDLFNAEVTPAHVLSLESFSKVKTLLNSNGVVVINTYGYLKDQNAKGNFSLMRTLKQAGFDYRFAYSGIKEIEDYRNLLIFARQQKVEEALYHEITAPEIPNEICVNSDDHLVLERYNASAAKRWRFYYLRNFILSAN